MQLERGSACLPVVCTFTAEVISGGRSGLERECNNYYERTAFSRSEIWRSSSFTSSSVVSISWEECGVGAFVWLSFAC